MQNIVILAGNIGQTPEVRTTQGGTKITNFTLATSRPRSPGRSRQRDENGYRVMDTEWHRITCFNGLGKTVAEYCEKGMKVLVHGRIHYTKWTDRRGRPLRLRDHRREGRLPEPRQARTGWWHRRRGGNPVLISTIMSPAASPPGSFAVDCTAVQASVTADCSACRNSASCSKPTNRRRLMPRCCRCYSTSDLSRKSGDIIAEALRHPVTITRAQQAAPGSPQH